MVKSTHGQIYPCGQCTFCRINSKREWIARLLLEAASHPYNQFWTLTYEPEKLNTCLPPNPGDRREREVHDEQAHHADGHKNQSNRVPHNAHIHRSANSNELAAAANQPGTLFKPDLARFFKRVRKNYGQFRYYAVGEYGGLAGRPHYHVLAFGIQLSPESLRETWKMGSVHIGDVESASINYCVEYSLKREKSAELIDLRRLPEFAVMSTNPGIGAYALSEFRQAILRSKPLPTGELLIPDSFKLLGKDYPVPRYIRNMLEDEGFLYAPKATQRYLNDAEVMHALLARSPVARREFAKYEQLFDASRSENYYQITPQDEEVLKQKIRNAETRQRIFGKRHETL